MALNESMERLTVVLVDPLLHATVTWMNAVDSLYIDTFHQVGHDTMDPSVCVERLTVVLVDLQPDVTVTWMMRRLVGMKVTWWTKKCCHWWKYAWDMMKDSQGNTECLPLKLGTWYALQSKQVRKHDLYRDEGTQYKCGFRITQVVECSNKM